MDTPMDTPMDTQAQLQAQYFTRMQKSQVRETNGCAAAGQGAQTCSARPLSDPTRGEGGGPGASAWGRSMGRRMRTCFWAETAGSSEPTVCSGWSGALLGAVASAVCSNWNGALLQKGHVLQRLKGQMRTSKTASWLGLPTLGAWMVCWASVEILSLLEGPGTALRWHPVCPSPPYSGP